MAPNRDLSFDADHDLILQKEKRVMV